MVRVKGEVTKAAIAFGRVNPKLATVELSFTTVMDRGDAIVFYEKLRERAQKLTQETSINGATLIELEGLGMMSLIESRPKQESSCPSGDPISS